MEAFLPIHYYVHHARRHPDRIAVRSEGIQYTYDELDRLSDELARQIRSTRPASKFRIGVHLSKTANYIAAILGVWKAGGTYVPVDPDLPVARRDYIIKNGDMHAVLTEQPVSDLNGAVAITLAAEQLAVPDRGDAPPPGGVGTDLAYIIYTSGTTGVPKGVMISNDSLMALMAWCNRYFGYLHAQQNIINIPRFSFDQSVLDIALFLCQGKTLYVLDDPKNIVGIPLVIDRWRINIMSTVPHVVGVLVNNPKILKKFSLESLRTIILGGAVCPSNYIGLIKEALPGRRIYNLYGPTEATVYCLAYRADDKRVDEAQPLPIGEPFDNTEVLILDEQQRPCAAGQAGEIALSGPQVMAGYWNLPEKNAEVLIPDPRDSFCYNRVYRTGDQGFVDEQGVFHFRGRNDSTIKVSGYRVDLNEISHHLFLHPAVSEAAAVKVPDELLENKIHAFLTLKPGCEFTVQAAEAYIKSRLPHYMTPHFFSFVGSLPKNSSGKIDTRALEAQAKDRQ